jgi:hypothetical protein
LLLTTTHEPHEVVIDGVVGDRPIHGLPGHPWAVVGCPGVHARAEGERLQHLRGLQPVQWPITASGAVCIAWRRFPESNVRPPGWSRESEPARCCTSHPPGGRQRALNRGEPVVGGCGCSP